MIIALLVVWLLGGLVLALLVGGAVRVADAQYKLTAAVEQPEVRAPVAV